jgi:hypothetical protein
MCNRTCAASLLAVAIALAFPANAQSVISAHSGVIHFFDGAVYLGSEPLEAHLGKFPVIPLGGELRTEQGRAEVLLTPGVFLRLGQQSAIRMVTNDLANTQVELVTGSAIMDAGESSSGTSVMLLYKDWRVHLLQKGVYRIDSDPPRVWVRQGEAEVSAGPNGDPIPVGQGKNLPLAAVLVPERSSVQPGDGLTDWADGRRQSIAADNAITAQIDEDPGARTTDLDAFTYFPPIGVPSLPPGSSYPYGLYDSYQPGFSSIYLPGYTYRPLILGLYGSGGVYGNGIRPYTLSRPRPIMVSPGAGSYVGVPRAPLPRPSFSPPATIHAPARAPIIHGGPHR